LVVEKDVMKPECQLNTVDGVALAELLVLLLMSDSEVMHIS